MTSYENGVVFDFYGNGAPRLQMAWTSANDDDAWLAFDRNGNAFIDNGSELFSSVAPQPDPTLPEIRNGFNALIQFDKPENGGNNDGKISRRDAIFTSLRLWQDVNHNGVSETGELRTLQDAGLATIDLDYKELRRVDQYGNHFRYRAKIKDVRGAQLGRWMFDVFPVAHPVN
jgi:hypothetical protein